MQSTDTSTNHWKGIFKAHLIPLMKARGEQTPRTRIRSKCHFMTEKLGLV